MAEAKIYVPTTDTRGPARTYNQLHRPRPYTRGRRRVSIYVCWSFPGEANRDASDLDNRFSTMTEVRRVEWPFWEGPEWADPMLFQQGIAGALELFFRAWMPFQQLVTEVTDNVVPVFQRVDQAGYRLPIDERVLDDTDTLLVFGLDHLLTEQEASAEEIDAVQRWLAREGTTLVLGPHHDVGISADLNERAMEYAHHGDALVPRQQRFGKYTRSLMKGLGVPVENRFGLRPGVVAGTTADRAADHEPRPRHAGAGSKASRTSASTSTSPTMRSPAMTPRCTSWAASRSTCPSRTRSPRPATASSTRSCGCLRGASGAERCCSPTRRSSAPCSAPTTA